MKKRYIVSLIFTFLAGVSSIHAMEQAASPSCEQKNLVKLVFRGLSSYKPKLSEAEKIEAGTAIDILKWMLDESQDEATDLSDSFIHELEFSAPELVKSFKRLISLNPNIKASNIIKDRSDANSIIALCKKHKDVYLSELLNTEKLELLKNRLSLVTSPMMRDFYKDKYHSQFGRILNALYFGLEDALVGSCTFSDEASCGKKENQIGSLATIKGLLIKVDAIGDRLSSGVKASIINELLTKIDQITSRSDYAKTHTPEEVSMQWDLKGFAFEFEMLLKVDALCAEVGPITHFNYSVKNPNSLWKDRTDFDVITEKAVFEFKSAFFNRNNESQAEKVRKQFSNQFRAMKELNLPKTYIFVGEKAPNTWAFFNFFTRDRSSSSCNYLKRVDDKGPEILFTGEQKNSFSPYNDLKHTWGDNLPRILFTNAARLEDIELRYIRTDRPVCNTAEEGGFNVNQYSPGYLRTISEEARRLRLRIGVPLADDEEYVNAPSDEEAVSMNEYPPLTTKKTRDEQLLENFLAQARLIKPDANYGDLLRNKL